MSGGGGTVGGTVVGGPTPYAAQMGGYINAQAAQAASQAATQQTDNAIAAIQQQYAQSAASLKPYTTEGIQALDQLNQYIGLNAYDPGTAPTAPINPANQKPSDVIMPSAVRQNILANIGPAPQGSFDGSQYFGAGAHATGFTLNPSIRSQDIGHINDIMNDPQIQNANQQELFKDYQIMNAPVYAGNLAAYNQQMDVYNQAKALQQQYNAQGPLTPDQVQAKLANTPGYQFQLGQGLDAIQRSASSQGMLGSGRLLQALSDYGQGMASQTYGDTLSRLASLAGAGQQAATSLAGASQQTGRNVGQLYQGLGDTQANSLLAAANAQSQGYLAGHQQYQIIGGQSGGGGMGGIGQALGGLGSLASGLSGLFG